MQIEVGPEKRSLYVHHGLLIENAEFFRTALKQEWFEGQQRTVTLREDNYEIVIIYAQWLYTGQFFMSARNAEGQPLYLPLIKSYVLGEKLLDPTFQDLVLNTIAALSREEHGPELTRYFPGDEAYAILYKGTTSSSPARRLMVHMIIGQGDASWVAKGSDRRWDAPEELKDDLLAELMEKGDLLEPDDKRYQFLEKGIPCAYHMHGKGTPCSGPSK